MRLIMALGFLMFWSSQVLANCSVDSVQLRGEWGQVSFNVELADTIEERSQGLMFRESMPRSTGMLFVFDAPRRATFWMKNTFIPLDMLFVDRSGVVRHVHHNAIPGDLTTIDGGNNIYVVLEINAGLAETYGISVGSQMRHQVFFDGPAIWPC